jgi:DNA-binding response OmpR family regulator
MMPLTVGKPKILVVEDEPFLLDSMIIILSSEDYEVSGASNGQMALESIAASLPDLVISDVMMPVMDGYQLINHLRADAKTVALPVIVLSGRVDETFVEQGLAIGATTFIKKPFEINEFLAAVSRVFANIKPQ